MGWLSGFRTRTQALRAEWPTRGTVLRGAWVGNNYWMAFDPGNGVAPFIILFHLERRGPGDWAIKVMDEADGPVWYNCPKTILAAAPNHHDAGYSKSWREGVALHHERRRARKTTYGS